MARIIRRSRRTSALLTVAALLGGAVTYVGLDAATATHTPADKVVAGGSTVEVAGPGQEVPLLEATLRTSKPADLMLQVSMECSIITDVQTGPSNMPGATDVASAEGTIRVWVEIDGEVVPINSVSSPPQDAPEPGDKATDGVTFCNRVHEQDVADGESPGDGLDKHRTYLETKAANAFNWLRLNAGSGVHQIVVKADLTTNSAGEMAEAEAMIGNRTLIVEPTKMANDASI